MLGTNSENVASINANRERTIRRRKLVPVSLAPSMMRIPGHVNTDSGAM